MDVAGLVDDAHALALRPGNGATDRADILVSEKSRNKNGRRGFCRMSEIISGRIAQEITRATGLSSADFGILMQGG